MRKHQFRLYYQHEHIINEADLEVLLVFGGGQVNACYKERTCVDGRCEV